jgi:hypothetical protein
MDDDARERCRHEVQLDAPPAPSDNVGAVVFRERDTGELLIQLLRLSAEQRIVRTGVVQRRSKAAATARRRRSLRARPRRWSSSRGTRPQGSSGAPQNRAKAGPREPLGPFGGYLCTTTSSMSTMGSRDGPAVATPNYSYEAIKRRSNALLHGSPAAWRQLVDSTPPRACAYGSVHQTTGGLRRSGTPYWATPGCSQYRRGVEPEPNRPERRVPPRELRDRRTVGRAARKARPQRSVPLRLRAGTRRMPRAAESMTSPRDAATPRKAPGRSVLRPRAARGRRGHSPNRERRRPDQRRRDPDGRPKT